MTPLRRTCLPLFILIGVQLFDGCAVSSTPEILHAASACRPARSVPCIPLRKTRNSTLGFVLPVRGGGHIGGKAGIENLADILRKMGEELRVDRTQDLKLLRLVRDPLPFPMEFPFPILSSIPIPFSLPIPIPLPYLTRKGSEAHLLMIVWGNRM